MVLKDAFAALIDIPADKRSASLEKLDPELRQRLEALLDADANADSVLHRFYATLPPHHDSPETSSIPTMGDTGAWATNDPLGLCGRTVAHFRVLDLVGAGGMGVVYRAQDESLGRTVALKFPLPQYSIDAMTRTRFLQEARAASALDHPNVCTVYEAGETEDEHPFLAMAYYSGETLRSRLAREGPLPVDEVIDVARALLRALHAAHAAGVVHRDVKPGNVMLAADGSSGGGTVKLLDFGVAKLRDLTVNVASSRHLAGTTPYMSPEQLRGHAVDGRADLWSLGVVLYEMLTGKLPFGGVGLSTVFAILNEDPEPPSRLRSDVPVACDAIVRRLLSKEPADRFASAEEALAELERTARGSQRARGIRALVRRRSFQLVSLATAAVIVLAVAVVAKRAGQDRKTLVPPVGQTTRDSIARELYLEGSRNAVIRDSMHLALAESNLRQALERDSNFAEALAALADVYVVQSNFGYRSASKGVALARDAADRAITLNPLLGEAYAAKGWVYASRSTRASLDSAEASFQRAIKLNPNAAWSFHGYSLMLTMELRIPDALSENDRALLLNPLMPGARSFRGVLIYMTGNKAEAIRLLKAAGDINPDYVVPFYYLGIFEAGEKHYKEALPYLEHAREKSARFPGVLSALGFTYAKLGRLKDADSAFASLRAGGDDDRSRIDRALGEAVQGHVDRAFAMLGHPNWDLPSTHNLVINPLLAAFRGDPRYKALAKEIGITR